MVSQWPATVGGDWTVWTDHTHSEHQHDTGRSTMTTREQNTAGVRHTIKCGGHCEGHCKECNVNVRHMRGVRVNVRHVRNVKLTVRGVEGCWSRIDLTRNANSSTLRHTSPRRVVKETNVTRATNNHKKRGNNSFYI